MALVAPPSKRSGAFWSAGRLASAFFRTSIRLDLQVAIRYLAEEAGEQRERDLLGQKALMLLFRRVAARRGWGVQKLVAVADAGHMFGTCVRYMRRS